MPRPFAPKRWRLHAADDDASQTLQRELNLHPTVAMLLVQRGINTPEAAHRFLYPSLDHMHDPFLLPDAEAACERLKTALHRKEKILIHGDYDGDGVTSAALWTRCLRALGADVDVFVPHRSRDGYDMRTAFVERAQQEGVKLIVTTDCGIQRIAEVERARELGIDVIITDHHTPNASGALPQAVAVVNPHRSDSRYPFEDLAGVGVAFKLCEALSMHLGINVANYRRGYMDLAAIGTVTDVMPLIDENRILVKFGLEALQNTRKPGLRALADISGFAEKAIDSHGVAFGMGPRLNSASRIDETQHALNLLLTKDEDEARMLAQMLDGFNAERRTVQERIFQEAMTQVMALDLESTRCIVVASEGWSGSVVGIVASKIVDRTCRPCIIIALDGEGGGRGSARSISAFNVFNAIDNCKPLLREYGGHAHAAGLSIEAHNVKAFAEQMNEIACMRLSEEDCVPTLMAAAEIPAEQVSARLLDQIALLKPFGNANPEPQFISKGVRIMDVKRMGKEQQHLKLILKAEGVNPLNTVDAPWWNRGELADVLNTEMSMDVCYRPQFNHFNGRRTIQFLLEDIRPADW
jgi:single-stranded-DNA-specific exonuclease